MRTEPEREREQGVSALEVSVLLAALAALIVVAVLTLNDSVGGVFDDTCRAVSGSGSCTR